jgi:hypothetical protein
MVSLGGTHGRAAAHHVTGYAYFAPTIIKTYGYDRMFLVVPVRSMLTSLAIMTQLYSIPPWAAAWGFSMLVAILSDKTRHRFAFTIGPMLIAMAGFGILLNVHGEAHRNVQYAALFLVTMGCYSAMPVIVCWYAMNLSGHRRRSVGTAWQVGFGNSKWFYPAWRSGTVGVLTRWQLGVSSRHMPS